MLRSVWEGWNQNPIIDTNKYFCSNNQWYHYMTELFLTLWLAEIHYSETEKNGKEWNVKIKQRTRKKYQ